MPFRSTAQQRFAFGTGQPWAKRWADETDFSSLPKRGARKSRKWGMRTKAANYSAHAGETIAGNLKRGNDGKFTSGGAAPPPRRGRKPRKAALTPEQRQAARNQARNDKRQAVIDAMAQADQGLAPNIAKAMLDFADGGQLDPAIARGLAGAGLVEMGSDGQPRLTSTGRMAATAMNRGDVRGALDAIGRGADRAGAAAQKKPKGGGGKGKKPPAPVVAKQPAPEQQARNAARTQRQAATEARRQAVEQRRQAREGQRNEQQQRELTDLSQRLEAGNKLTTSELQRLVTSGLAQRNGNTLTMTTAGHRQARRKPSVAAKSFTVFKDTSGKLRWITRTTTAYRDRDGEIISTKALTDDAARMTATQQYGPLRWWHVGKPDPLNPVAPWGPGVDIGDCDWSVVVGHTSVESGTFRSPEIAQFVASKGSEFEVSPGFFYAENQRDGAGVFWAIRRFERSIVPTRYGRASNLFTGLAVQEKAMQTLHIRYKALDQRTVDQRLLALKELGASDAIIAQLAADIQQSDKTATAQGVAFKSTDAPMVYAAPDGTPGLIVEGRFVALKVAAQLPMDAEDDPALGGDSGADEAAEGEPPMDAGDDGQYVGDMTPDEFKALLADVLAPVLKMQDMLKQMGDMHGELKTMYSGVATKDDTRAAELTALKTQQAEIDRRLKELEGDQPAAQAMPTNAEGDIAAALKNGPAEALADGTTPPPTGVSPEMWQIAGRVMSGAGSPSEFASRFHQS